MHGDPHLPPEKCGEPGGKEGTKARANFNSGPDHRHTVGRAGMHPGTGAGLRDSDPHPRVATETAEARTKTSVPVPTATRAATPAAHEPQSLTMPKASATQQKPGASQPLLSS